MIGVGPFSGWLFLPVTRLSSLHYASPHRFQIQCSEKREGPLPPLLGSHLPLLRSLLLSSR